MDAKIKCHCGASLEANDTNNTYVVGVLQNFLAAHEVCLKPLGELTPAAAQSLLHTAMQETWPDDLRDRYELRPTGQPADYGRGFKKLSEEIKRVLEGLPPADDGIAEYTITTDVRAALARAAGEGSKNSAALFSIIRWLGDNGVPAADLEDISKIPTIVAKIVQAGAQAGVEAEARSKGWRVPAIGSMVRLTKVPMGYQKQKNDELLLRGVELEIIGITGTVTAEQLDHFINAKQEWPWLFEAAVIAKLKSDKTQPAVFTIPLTHVEAVPIPANSLLDTPEPKTV